MDLKDMREAVRLAMQPLANSSRTLARSTRSVSTEMPTSTDLGDRRGDQVQDVVQVVDHQIQDHVTSVPRSLKNDRRWLSMNRAGSHGFSSSMAELNRSRCPP